MMRLQVRNAVSSSCSLAVSHGFAWVRGQRRCHLGITGYCATRVLRIRERDTSAAHFRAISCVCGISVLSIYRSQCLRKRSSERRSFAAPSHHNCCYRSIANS